MTLQTRAYYFIYVAVLLIGGCREDPGEISGPPAQVAIGVARVVLAAPVIIAMEKGFFAEERLDLKVKEYPFGKPALGAMFAGEVDMATAADIPIVLNNFTRDDFLVTAMFAANEDGCKLVARRDRGIDKPADLKGKKIGITLGTTAQFFLSTFLNSHGLMESEVEMVDLPQTELPGGIERGEVDAVAAFEPYAFQARRLLGDRAVKFAKTGLYRETALLAADRRFVEEHPETVRRVLRAIDRAVDFMRHNRKEAIAIMAGKMQLDEKFFHETWDANVFGLSLDQALIMTMEDQARWAMNNGLTAKKEIPNYLKLIHQEALLQVRPEAVTIIR